MLRHLARNNLEVTAAKVSRLNVQLEKLACIRADTPILVVGGVIRLRPQGWNLGLPSNRRTSNIRKFDS
jgi:hypothetical protein